jgi:predicted histidine transporter YuiF (NhaC family)
MTLPKDRREWQMLIGHILVFAGKCFRWLAIAYPIAIFLPWIIPPVLSLYEMLGFAEFWELQITAATMTLGIALLIFMVPLAGLGFIFKKIGTAICEEKTWARLFVGILSLVLAVYIPAWYLTTLGTVEFGTIWRTVLYGAVAILFLLPLKEVSTATQSPAADSQSPPAPAESS